MKLLEVSNCLQKLVSIINIIKERHNQLHKAKGIKFNRVTKTASIKQVLKSSLIVNKYGSLMLCAGIITTSKLVACS